MKQQQTGMKHLKHKIAKFKQKCTKLNRENRNIQSGRTERRNYDKAALTKKENGKTNENGFQRSAFVAVPFFLCYNHYYTENIIFQTH